MSSIRDLLRERSHEHLLEWLRFPPNHAALALEAAPADRTAAFDMAQSVLGHINELLKAAVDAGDVTTFKSVVRDWRMALRNDRTWTTDRYPLDSLAANLLVEQDRLMLGLLMWSAHVLEAAEPGDQEQGLKEIIRTAAAWFEDNDQLAAAFAAAGARDEPWTTWFLAELPSNEAHFMPTRVELRRALLLAAINLDPVQVTAVPIPDETLRHHLADLERELSRLGQQPGTWSSIIHEPPLARRGHVATGEEVGAPLSDDLERRSAKQEFSVRAERLLKLLPEARDLAEERYREQVRHADMDPERLDKFRAETLEASRTSRLVGAVLENAGVIRHHSSGLPENPLHVREWLHKDWFLRDSIWVGTDMAARDFGRLSRDQEFKEFLDSLGPHAPRRAEGDLRAAVVKYVRALRAAGSQHILVLIPLNWRLGRILAGSNLEAIPEGHAVVPAAFRREFEGLLDAETPILDYADVPEDRFYVVGLNAVRMDVWPSDEDSGVRYDLRAFDAASAAALVEAQPSVRGPEQSLEEAVRTIQERVLIDLTLCWRIRGVDAAFVAAFATPADPSPDR